MNQTTFHIKDMDCSSEEQLIRMRLEGMEGISGLEFDLTQRRLDVFHDGSPSAIADVLAPLNLGARQVEHREDVEMPTGDDDASNRGPLMWALAINSTLFVGEQSVELLQVVLARLVSCALELMQRTRAILGCAEHSLILQCIFEAFDRVGALAILAHRRKQCRHLRC